MYDYEAEVHLKKAFLKEGRTREFEGLKPDLMLSFHMLSVFILTRVCQGSIHLFDSFSLFLKEKTNKPSGCVESPSFLTHSVSPR